MKRTFMYDSKPIGWALVYPRKSVLRLMDQLPNGTPLLNGLAGEGDETPDVVPAIDPLAQRDIPRITPLEWCGCDPRARGILRQILASEVACFLVHAGIERRMSMSSISRPSVFIRTPLGLSGA
jgi:hypothetical protein